ncbi:MAG: cupin domain-containing protein [Candidatus Methylomirabilaceae bacterium]
MRAKVIHSGDGQYINVIGDHQYIKLTGEDTGGAYTLIEQVNPPGAGVPLHVHENEDEMFHVIRGEMKFTLDGKPLSASAGTRVYLPRRVPHAFTVVGQAEARVLVLLSPSGLERMFRELAQLPPGPPDMAKVVAICARYGVRFL